MTWALSFTLIPFFGEDLEAVKGQRVVEVNIYYRYFFLYLCVCYSFVLPLDNGKKKSVNEFLFGVPRLYFTLSCSTQPKCKWVKKEETW
jgi:hypothetical protein